MVLAENHPSYTFADYLSWDESKHCELIHGELFPYPTPMRRHQEVCGEIFYQLAKDLDGKTSHVYIGPFAVRLFEKKGDSPHKTDTVVEPDISVICDPEKLDDYGCQGAPDLIIEILSPSSRRHDKILKMNLYSEAGVREYWIVNTIDQSVDVFLLKDGVLRPHESYSADDEAVVTVLDDCTIDLVKVFDEGTF